MFNAPLARVKASLVNRWFILNECVTDERRISVTSAMFAASGVCAENTCPYDKLVGAEETIGRAPLNKYGGE